MNLLSLPPELRTIIYDLSFPPNHTQVQLIPYHASLPACHLNLPLSLYRVCKLIHAELPPLAAKLRALELVYIVRGPFVELADLNRCSHLSSSSSDDPDLARIQLFLRFAERLRLVGPEPTTDVGHHASDNSRKRPFQCKSSWLTAGPECAVRVLEVQPGAWGMTMFMCTVIECLGQLAGHPDVAARLHLRLIRDGKDGTATDEQKWVIMEEWLKRFEDLRLGNDLWRQLRVDG